MNTPNLQSVDKIESQRWQILLAVVFLLHAADGAMLPGIFKAFTWVVFQVFFFGGEQLKNM